MMKEMWEFLDGIGCIVHVTTHSFISHRSELINRSFFFQRKKNHVLAKIPQNLMEGGYNQMKLNLKF